MSSAAQLTANQANAELSTGPLTDATKAISSRNNLRHGFRSQTVLLPGDDPAEYNALFDELTAHFGSGAAQADTRAAVVRDTENGAAQADTRAAVVRGIQIDTTEQRFIREMADAEYSLRRVRACIEDALTRRIADLTADRPDADPVTLQTLAIETLKEATGTSYSTWLRYESKFENQYDRAYKGWIRYQDVSRRAAATDADTEMKRVMFGPVRGSAQSGQPAQSKQPDAKLASNVQRPSTPQQTPRNAPCPCGSGDKFKRCCGKSAPPVLSQAA